MATTPANWFDPEHYLISKADQLNEIEHDGRTDWTPAQVREAIVGDGDESLLYEHFLAYNAAEFTSPNQYFDVDYYFEQKAQQLNDENFNNQTWDAAAVRAFFEGNGISAWGHYQEHGFKRPEPFS